MTQITSPVPSAAPTATPTTERRAFGVPGIPVLLLTLLTGLIATGLFLSSWTLTGGFNTATIGLYVICFLLGLGTLISFNGFFTNEPNQATVITFFGRYVGTVRDTGYFWTNPLASKRFISLRIRNFDSEKLKVNDAGGSPIEIATVVVWRVQDTARAIFDVEDYEEFLELQTETALRHLAAQYHYDTDAPNALSLRSNPDEIAEALSRELTARLSHAGLDILEARLSHLAYAPEIAGAMLQRQQASAIIAARSQIVQGAVGMVQMAL